MTTSKTRKRFSIIVPAYNEEKKLGRTLSRLQEIRSKENVDLEIIVAVRESKDKTKDIAIEHADIVVEGGPVSTARNNGAAVATGEILIFLDADTVPNFGTFSEISNAVHHNTVGTCTAVPSQSGLMPYIAVGLRNMVRATGAIKGLSDLLFVHRSIVHDKKIGFDANRNMGEHYDFINRARKNAGGKFTYLRIPNGYEMDVDRYEREGYLNSLWFWLRWVIQVHLMGEKEEELEKAYWS